MLHYLTMFLSLSSVLLLPLVSSLNEVTIGAFNIKTFGPTKASNSYLMDNIKKIILDYDVILVQEIEDEGQKVMVQLNDSLNSVDGIKFRYIKSERLGRSSSKHQYAYYYRSDKVSITDSHQYNDVDDEFERAPLSVLLSIPRANKDNLQIALIGLHTRPLDAFQEVDKLSEVYVEVKDKFSTENVIIMGDMNADCSYMSEDDLQLLELFKKNSAFKSLIDSNTDTSTYTKRDCAYDRIVIRGDELKDLKMEAEVDLFDISLGLSYKDTVAVSDHYPVKVTVTL